ncbi:hypothetical protein DDE82_008214 [Stemphylium lycopersici]|nr:hypothetical protein DDE82_008214 [Stemphylium lycopersici]
MGFSHYGRSHKLADPNCIMPNREIRRVTQQQHIKP